MAGVYVLRCSDGTLYVGWTTDIGRRLREHNCGRGGRYTRGRRPLVLVYWEEAPSSRRARLREASLKRMSRRAKLALIGGSGG